MNAGNVKPVSCGIGAMKSRMPQFRALDLFHLRVESHLKGRIILTQHQAWMHACKPEASLNKKFRTNFQQTSQPLSSVSLQLAKVWQPQFLKCCHNQEAAGYWIGNLCSMSYHRTQAMLPRNWQLAYGLAWSLTSTSPQKRHDCSRSSQYLWQQPCSG